MRFFNINIKLVIFLLVFINSAYADIVRRAALDIGSGDTKLIIADVDTETSKIVNICYQNHKSVKLRQDLAASRDETLSSKIESELLAVLNDYKMSTAELSPDSWSGIGTSVFRKAKNGEKLLKRIKAETGITIHLATPVEEGEIGFKSAVAASGLDVNQVIAWDSGAGSFQITSMHGDRLEVYGAEFAATPAIQLFMNKIRGEAFYPGCTPNPISTEEAELLATLIQNEELPPIPSWLASTNKTVVSFGGPSSIFSVGLIATGKESYTQEDVLAAIQKFAGKTDDALGIFPEPYAALTSLVLLHSVMNHCNINHMIYKKTNGSCEGLLIMPRYWN